MLRKFALIAIAASVFAFTTSVALAQDSTTGGVRGIVEDAQTGEPIAGATVVITGPALQGQQAAITDGSGEYRLPNLPPGVYVVTVYYADVQFARPNVLVRLGKVAVVNLDLNTQATKGETIVLEGRAPVIDQNSTKTGVTITEDYTRNVPTGRTFGAVLGAAAGTQGDTYGISVGGSTSVENVYIIEGLNTTDPAFGLLSSNLPNEFVRETEVITGGYNAEYGRSTGGVVNVVTKSGSNEFHGSVFGYITPGALSASEDPTPRAGSAIDRNDKLEYDMDIGAEVGGPIIEDKLWFHAGFNPSISSYDVYRIIKTQVDNDGDGVPDVDQNGFSILEEVDRRNLSRTGTTYFYTGKITGAVSPNHQGSVSLFGNPESRDSYRTVTGVESAGLLDVEDGAFDVSGKWTSKFFDNATQVDAVVGWHRNRFNEFAATAAGDDPQIRYDPARPLTFYNGYEIGGAPAACDDSAVDDPYPMIDNCPVQFYNVGGIGFRENQQTDRYSGVVSLTQRVKAAGHHTFKGGVDFEHQNYDHLSDFTGGTRYLLRTNGTWRIDRFFTVRDDGMTPCGSDIDGDGAPEANCTFQEDGLLADTTTQNIGAYFQDSWAILPNLTVNAGIRWEQQKLFIADDVQGETSPTTGEEIPEVAFKINDMWAPRAGVIYDFTQEGKSKVYGHWGRFYESIPMDINARAYGGEVFNVNILLPDQCTDETNPIDTCDVDNAVFAGYFGGGEELAVPGLNGQYLDEIVLGGEYEILDDFKVGAAYIRRELGSVIEDVSTDGANTYIVANPGEVNQGVVDDLRDQAEAERMAGNDARADFLDFKADNFEGVGVFDKPHREYNAIEIKAEKRFSDKFMVLGSYTYSKLRGNFPGLFSPETGQLDPNLTSMYDLPELMANRYGNLAADRPHNIKLDGFYVLPVSEAVGYFVFGGSFRGTSGTPKNVLGGHTLYGTGESYIIGRGDGGRTPFLTRVDVKLQYGRTLTKTTKLEAFVDVFNLFNSQTQTRIDENYTFESVNPIVGGDDEDLEHVKALDPSSGLPLARAPLANPNYGNTALRQAPLSVRFGLRLTF